MKKDKLIFHKASEDTWHCVLRNNHGRKIYIKVNFTNENNINICECFYIHRTWEAVPKKQQTKYCKEEDLLSVLATEIDKKFYGVEFVEDEEVISTEAYIKHWCQNDKKHKFLILVDSDGILKTRLKNRTHRVIYLEINRNVNRALISCCHYCDRRYKSDNRIVVPSGMKTIYFEFSLETILKIVNDELNCDFTDIIITSDTFNFSETKLPICGSI